MLKPLFRASMAALVAFSFVVYAVPASADGTGPLGSGVVPGANTAIRNMMDSRPVAQVPPITQQPVGGKGEQGLPTGFTYFLDASEAYPFGNIGTFGKHWLPSGVDAMVGYGFNPQERLVAFYYELQHYPVGFNSGQVNLNLPPGFPPSPGVNPSCVDLSGANSATCAGIASPINVTTKDRVLLLNFEQLITVGTMKGRPIPVVITPTFVSRWSTVGGSPYANSDVVPFVDQNGVPHTDIHTRTAQYDSLAVTFPFLKTPKMFGTLTLAPTVLTHLNGVNQQNAVQLYQILYLEYNLNKDTRFFFEPQASRDYLPTDPYAQHLNAIFIGATHRLGKDGFVQLVYNSGGPSNYGNAGVRYLQCYALPCSQNTLPAVGALRAQQLQFQIGIGSPVVLPF